ncbi:MAG: hypothetical protein K0V04_39135 [Deltaproteobacteria bacterium]|nr:hypothetical protein [Deltaproteobacteria bacterium]
MSDAPQPQAGPANQVAPGEDVNVLVAPVLSVDSHLWQEFHTDAPTTPYQGPTQDDRRVAEHIDDDDALVAKASLHLCFVERAITTVELVVPAGVTCYAKWEIVDAQDTVVREHPSYSAARYDSENSAASIAAGRHGWCWDGRNSDANPVFVAAATYRSRLTVKDSSGTEITSEATIVLEGDPYRIFVAGVPKSDEDLRGEFERGIYTDRLLDQSGQRSARDCWIKVWRGQQDDGHVTFLGQGTIEATNAPNADGIGAVATPHGRDYKGFVRPNPHGEAKSADRIQIQDEGVTDGRIALRNPGGPAPTNPYSVGQGSYKDGVQAHQGNSTWTTNGLSVGCTTVSPIAGATVQRPGSTLGDLRSINSAFGGWGDPGDGEQVSTRGPSFANKQSKRDNAADALIADDHAAPELDPPQHPAPADETAPADEPLHMQPTLQAAAFGGFLGHEIPRTMAVVDEPTNQARIRVTLAEPDDDDYSVYHRAVVFGHSWDEPTTGQTRVTVWIPRKVTRSWNGNDKNLLVRGRCTIAWWIERRNAATPQVAGEVVHAFFPATTTPVPDPIPVPTLTDLPNNYIGRRRHSWTRPATLTAGLYVSVLKYRVRLTPYVAGSDDWVAEPATADTFVTPGTDVTGGASLSAEALITDAAQRFVEGRSELVVLTVT